MDQNFNVTPATLNYYRRKGWKILQTANIGKDFLNRAPLALDITAKITTRTAAKQKTITRVN